MLDGAARYGLFADDMGQLDVVCDLRRSMVSTWARFLAGALQVLGRPYATMGSHLHSGPLLSCNAPHFLARNVLSCHAAGGSDEFRHAFARSGVPPQRRR